MYASKISCYTSTPNKWCLSGSNPNKWYRSWLLTIWEEEICEKQTEEEMISFADELSDVERLKTLNKMLCFKSSWINRR